RARWKSPPAGCPRVGWLRRCIGTQDGRYAGDMLEAAASTLRLVVQPPACRLSHIAPECSSTRSQAQGVPDLGSQPGHLLADCCASQSILAARELHASRSLA